MSSRLNVIFMGTPDFAVPSLKALNEFGCHIPLVVTQVDRPKGRGRKMTPPPVKLTALELNYPVLQPDTLKAENVIQKIAQVRPDLIVVVAFGHILPEAIIKIPAYGAINVHASLLPKYRGPAPIQHAIINGESETGITIMQLDKGLDTGDILLSVNEPIHSNDTSETLHDRLASAGALLLKNTISSIESNTITPIPQDHSKATYAPMLYKKDGHIDWTLSAVQIERLIRGLTPWPGAYTFYEKKRFKIFKTEIKKALANEKPGTIIQGFSNELRVATGDGVLSIKEIQGSSGKRLSINDFLRGTPVPVGTVFT